ncbi:MAG: CinA family nicotinamide mononucleotide deamidase-related protein [Sphingomonadaceae bacterium]
MKGEILSVGTELLLGQLVDTNAPYLAQSLSTLGIDVFWISQVGDNQSRLVDALRRGWERSDLIVISGGVGPTGDDLTREAIAELLGEEMVVQPELEAELRAFFARRGRTMPERNVKQATLIPSAQALPNPIGTAPGWWVQRDGHVIVAMPGVPVEMKRMWEQEVLPRLSRLAGTGVIFSRTLKVLGMGESWVEDELKGLISSPNPTVATYAKEDGIHVRVTAKASTAESAQAMVAGMEAHVRQILGDHIYGVDEESVPDAVMALLQRRGLTLATLEACTAGQLSTALSAAEMNAPFLGGACVLSPELLALYGVDGGSIGQGGLVSEAAARAMSVAARQFMKARVGLAVVCGMEDGVEGEQRLGVVHCAVDWGGEITCATSRYTTTLKEVRRRAVLDAMDLLRRRLLAAG